MTRPPFNRDRRPPRPPQRRPGESVDLAPGALRVLYEDNHLIAVFKPAGVLTQGDITGDRSLMDVVKDWLKAKYQKPGNVFLGLVHRLDRPVAGVVLFGKTSKGASRMSEQFRERHAKKTYRALVEGVPAEESATLVHYFEGDAADELRVYDAPGPDRKEARLSYRVLRRFPRQALLEVDLETGRKHQIRVQLARIGHPIVGDTRHGATTSFPGGVALVAKRLRFKHATERDREVVIEVPDELCPISRWLASR